MFVKVLAAYGLREDDCAIRAYGTGLINHTWKITTPHSEYILQRINHEVFTRPRFIAENIDALATWLHRHFPEYHFIRPLLTATGQPLVHTEENGYFRLMPFVANSHTYDVANSPQLAGEAARQFGKFTRLLSGFPASQLHITLPDFHNLAIRYQQFDTACSEGNPTRIAEARELIATIRRYEHILTRYEAIRTNPDFRLRVTHHDTKISNVLFGPSDQGLCVIDLDTVMPGYFISDFGDMMRTYLSPVSEEEKDFSRIIIREDYFSAIVRGYLGEMNGELTPAEINHVVYAGQFMVYMQALRFLTDHLENDRYYGARYQGHNLLRAGNQITLLEKITERETALQELVTSYPWTLAG